MKSNRLLLGFLPLLGALGLLGSASLASATGAPLQTPADRAAKSDVIVTKVRQVDLLNHLLPIIWTKPELDVLLPAIETARENVKKAQELEYDDLVTLDAAVSTVLDKAVKEGEVPSKDDVRKFAMIMRTMDANREVVIAKNDKLVFAALSDLNDGQRKAMANSLDPGLMDPSLKVEKMSDDDKIHFYVRNILLDPLAYDLLVKMSMGKYTADK